LIRACNRSSSIKNLLQYEWSRLVNQLKGTGKVYELLHFKLAENNTALKKKEHNSIYQITKEKTREDLQSHAGQEENLWDRTFENSVKLKYGHIIRYR